MKFPMIRIAIIAALATPVLPLPAQAQTDDGFDAFGITNDGTSLDDLVPDTGELPPPQPYVEDANAADPTTEPTALGSVVNAVAPVDGPPAIATFDAPSDWVSYEIKDVQFKLPPGWEVVEERRNELILFSGDKASRTGVTFGLILRRKPEPDNSSDEAFVSKTDVTMPNGEIYQRVELKGEQDGIVIHAVTYTSPNQNADNKYPQVVFSTMNQPFEGSRAILENILGTIIMPEKYVKPRDVGLGGMVTFDAPKRWMVSQARDNNQVSFRSQYYTAYIEIARAGRVTDEMGLDDTVPDHATAPEAAQILGYAATRQTWPGTKPEFYLKADMVPGEFTYYRLTQCLPDGSPIGILLAGAAEFQKSEEFTTALASVKFTFPDGMIDCGAPAAPSASGQAGGGASDMDAATAPAPATSAPSETGKATAPMTGQQMTGQQMAVADASFVVPSEWVVNYQDADSKLLKHPDEPLSIQAYWWDAAAPSSDVEGEQISVDHFVANNEAVTRVIYKLERGFLVLTMAENARADGKHFFLELIAPGSTLEEAQALNKQLIGSLRLQSVLVSNGKDASGSIAMPTSALPIIAAFEAPSDWVDHKINGLYFLAPADWIVAKENNTAIMLFQGDIATFTGAAFGVSFKEESEPVGMEDTDFLSKTNVTMPDGETYMRFEVKDDSGGTSMRAFTYISPNPNANGNYAWITTSTMNQAFDGSREVLERILGTVSKSAKTAATSTPAPVQDAAPTGTLVDIENITFVLPNGWKETGGGSSSNKMFASPDGRVTILAFWWFPDEPLTGYDDDITVKNTIIDHEPVTQITSHIAQRYVIQNVSERARADEKRFIFTIEATDMGLEEVQALNTDLINNLRLQPALDPNWKEPPLKSPENQLIQTKDWKHYSNDRFGTQIDYPAHLFAALPPPDNNDGRSFSGIGGGQRFYVFGQYNVEDLGVQGLLDRDILMGGYDHVTYKVAREHWYVLSGFLGENIFYRKVLLDSENGVLQIFEITYPKSEKPTFDKITIKMAKSFSGP